MAVKEIQKLVENQGFLSKPVPGIELVLRKQTETEDDALERLLQEGVNVFIGDSLSLSASIPEDCTILANKYTGRNVSKQMLEVPPDLELLAVSYVHTIYKTSPNKKGFIEVLPVMRDEPWAKAFHKKVEQTVKKYPKIELLDPIVYTPTQYPRSDAFEVVSTIGSHIAVKPNTEVTIIGELPIFYCRILSGFYH